MDARPTAMVVIFPLVKPPKDPSDEGRIHWLYGRLGKELARNHLKLVVGEHQHPSAERQLPNRSQTFLCDEFMKELGYPPIYRKSDHAEILGSYCDGPPLNPTDAEPQLAIADYVIFGGCLQDAARWIAKTKPTCRIGFVAVQGYWRPMVQLLKTGAVTALRSRSWAFLDPGLTFFSFEL